MMECLWLYNLYLDLLFNLFNKTFCIKNIRRTYIFFVRLSKFTQRFINFVALSLWFMNMRFNVLDWVMIYFFMFDICFYLLIFKHIYFLLFFKNSIVKLYGNLNHYFLFVCWTITKITKPIIPKIHKPTIILIFIFLQYNIF